MGRVRGARRGPARSGVHGTDFNPPTVRNDALPPPHSADRGGRGANCIGRGVVELDGFSTRTIRQVLRGR